MATSTIKQPATTIIAKDYSYEYNGFAGGSSMTITAAQMGFVTPDGYAPLSVLTVDSGHAAVVLERVSAYLDQRIRNVSSTNQSGTYRMRVVYTKV